MVTSSRQPSAPTHDPSNTNSAKTKTIVDGATESGRTAHVPAIKSAASLVGTATKTRWRTVAAIVPTTTSRFRDSGAVHRRTVRFIAAFQLT